MAKSRKKRSKKIYDVKVLKEKWNLEKFDQKKFNAKSETICAIAGTFLLIIIGSLIFLAVYEPIEREEAIVREIEFDHYESHFSGLGRKRHVIILTDGEKIWIYTANEEMAKTLKILPSGTILKLELHPKGTVLGISMENIVILDFDHTQEKCYKQSIIYLLFGILLFAGAIVCGTFASKRIFKEKVFSQ